MKPGEFVPIMDFNFSLTQPRMEPIFNVCAVQADGTTYIGKAPLRPTPHRMLLMYSAKQVENIDRFSSPLDISWEENKDKLALSNRVKQLTLTNVEMVFELEWDPESVS